MKKLNLASLNNAEANYLLQFRPTSITTLNFRVSNKFQILITRNITRYYKFYKSDIWFKNPIN